MKKQLTKKQRDMVTSKIRKYALIANNFEGAAKQAELVKVFRLLDVLENGYDSTCPFEDYISFVGD